MLTTALLLEQGWPSIGHFNTFNDDLLFLLNLYGIDLELIADWFSIAKAGNTLEGRLLCLALFAQQVKDAGERGRQWVTSLRSESQEYYILLKKNCLFPSWLCQLLLAMYRFFDWLFENWDTRWVDLVEEEIVYQITRDCYLGDLFFFPNSGS